MFPASPMPAVHNPTMSSPHARGHKRQHGSLNQLIESIHFIGSCQFYQPFMRPQSRCRTPGGMGYRFGVTAASRRATIGDGDKIVQPGRLPECTGCDIARCPLRGGVARHNRRASRNHPAMLPIAKGDQTRRRIEHKMRIRGLGRVPRSGRWLHTSLPCGVATSSWTAPSAIGAPGRMSCCPGKLEPTPTDSPVVGVACSAATVLSARSSKTGATSGGPTLRRARR